MLVGSGTRPVEVVHAGVMTGAWMDVAAGQDTVLGRKQARAAGMTEDAWQWKLDEADWSPILPGVVATHSGAVTWGQQCWAALVKVAPAALSGDAGLLALGMSLNGVRVIDVVRAGTAGKRWRFPDGVVLRPHQMGRFCEQLETASSGLAVVRAPLAVFHAAVWAPSPRAADFRIAAAVQQGLASPAEIREQVLANAHLPRSEQALVVLDDVELGAHAMSELDFLALCRAWQLPEPDELQVRVRTQGGTRYLDGRYRKQRVRFEVDGRHHMLVANWERDLVRGNDVAISARGRDEISLRWSGSQVRYAQSLVARQLGTALSS